MMMMMMMSRGRRAVALLALARGGPAAALGLDLASRPRPRCGRRLAALAGAAAPPAYTEVRVRCGAGRPLGPEEVSEVLLELGAMSVETSDADAGTAAEAPILSASTAPRREGGEHWPRTLVTALVPSGAGEGLLQGLERIYGAAVLAALEPALAPVEDKDWLAEQERLRPPICIGGLRIALPWHDPDPAAQVELHVEGGAAFGTGEHQTTRLCCEFVQARAADLRGRRVLDYGSGSGILALAARAYGAAEAIGVDIDPEALETARRNARLNGMQDRARFYLPSSDAALPAPGGAHANDRSRLPADAGRFPVVLANILLNPLLELRDTIVDRLEPGGVLAVAGIRANQADAVRPPSPPPPLHAPSPRRSSPPTRPSSRPPRSPRTSTTGSSSSSPRETRDRCDPTREPEWDAPPGTSAEAPLPRR